MSVAARIFSALAISLFLVVVFLHNPLGGWEYRTYVPYKPQVPCTREMYERLMRIMQKEFTEEDLQTWISKCAAPSGQWELLPFTEWRSQEPVLVWFGSVKNSMIVVGYFLIGIAAFYFIFRPRKSK